MRYGLQKAGQSFFVQRQKPVPFIKTPRTVVVAMTSDVDPRDAARTKPGFQCVEHCSADALTEMLTADRHIVELDDQATARG